jgi:hypothetical protein
LRCFGIEPARHNVGSAVNPAGRLVMFGRKGDSDIQAQIPAGWGDASGKALHIEVKHERFDPSRLRGRAREHFDRQLARLRKTNHNGGYALWVTDATQVVHALGRIREGWRIELEADWPILTDEPRPSAPSSRQAGYTPRGEAEAPSGDASDDPARGCPGEASRPSGQDASTGRENPEISPEWT